MKTLMGLLPLLLVVAGCTTTGAVGASGNGGASTVSFDDSPHAAPDTPNMAPRLVIPATGGPPVLSLPLGGDLFLPVTGGPPTPGVPIAP